MQGLTKKQRAIIDFIDFFSTANLYSPNYRDIMQHFGFSSPGSVYKHLKLLKQKGFIGFEKYARRSLSVISHLESTDKLGLLHVPLIGTLSAGFPIKMFSTTQTILIPSTLVRNLEKTYILQIADDSLHEECMAKGDLLVIEARSEASDGELVVALINHHDTIIKRYKSEGQYIKLESKNTAQQPMILHLEDILIQGVVNGLFRTEFS